MNTPFSLACLYEVGEGGPGVTDPGYSRKP